VWRWLFLSFLQLQLILRVDSTDLDWLFRVIQMFRKQIQTIIERSDSAEQAAYLIVYLFSTKPGMDNSSIFEGDGLMQTLLRERASDMAQMIRNFGIS
jgi:hypothetical protein